MLEFIYIFNIIILKKKLKSYNFFLIDKNTLREYHFI